MNLKWSQICSFFCPSFFRVPRLLHINLKFTYMFFSYSEYVYDRLNSYLLDKALYYSIIMTKLSVCFYKHLGFYETLVYSTKWKWVGN